MPSSPNLPSPLFSAALTRFISLVLNFLDLQFVFLLWVFVSVQESRPKPLPRTGVDNFPYVSSDGNNSSSKISPVPPRTEGEILESSNMKSFAFSDLKMATRNFRPDSLLGGGGFGFVFKGWIDENTFAATKPGTGVTIAVKKLHQESFQGHREWLAEVNYLGQFSHPNLVKLILQCRYKKWRIKDLLLFRSASESRAKDNDEELVGKYESAKRAVRREDDGDVRGSSSRRRSRPSISAHEVHYTINRQLSKEMKKMTFLPYKQGLLACLRFHRTVPDASVK